MVKLALSSDRCLYIYRKEKKERKEAVVEQLGPSGRSMMRREKAELGTPQLSLAVPNNKPTTTTTTSDGLPSPQPAVSTAVSPSGLPVSPLIDLPLFIIIFPQSW